MSGTTPEPPHQQQQDDREEELPTTQLPTVVRPAGLVAPCDEEISDSDKSAQTDSFEATQTDDQAASEPDDQDADGAIHVAKPLRYGDTPEYVLGHNEQTEEPVVVVTWRKAIGSTRKFARKQYAKPEPHYMDIELGVEVNRRLIPMLRTKPQSEREDKILYLQRLHWWSHGPKQLLVACSWIVGLVFGSIGLASLNLPTWQDVSIYASLGWTLLCVIVFFIIQIPWMFTLLLVTNTRVMLIYRPPWPLQENEKEIQLTDLINPEVNISILGRMLKFGTAHGETAAQKRDEWMRDGLHYIRYPWQFKEALVSQSSK